MELLHAPCARVRPRAAIACVFVLLTLAPASAARGQNDPVIITTFVSAAAAQHEVFVEGLAELTAAVAGTYGDEGVLIGRALDKMAGGLAEWDRAIQSVEARLARALPNAPPHAAFQMRVTLGGLYADRGRLADALRELDFATRLEPQRADPHLLRGLVLDASGRSTEAGEAFRKAWVLDASDPIKAYYVLRHAAAIDTKDVHAAREVLAVAYMRRLKDGARAKASPFVGIELLHDDAAETPVLAPVAYARGYTHIAHGEYNEAIAEFRKAAAIDSLVSDPAREDSSEADRIRGLTYWVNGQDDKSIEQLEIAIRKNPRDERARLALARVLSSAGRDSDAEHALRETIQILPGSVLARWWLAQGYERVNRFADARREYELASAGAVAGRSWVYASIGRLAQDAVDFPVAVDAFAHAVAARPNDPMGHRQLAGLFLQQDRADEAFGELVAALLIDPLDVVAHAYIGQIYLNAGRYDDAVTAPRRALELSAGYTDARYALATALARLGHTQEASREFERVEQAQRQMLADRRRQMAVDVLKEEAAR